MNKKVAIIIERAETALGGAERAVFELSNALISIGYNTDILAAKGEANAKNIYTLCKDIPGKRTNYSIFERALKKHLSENSYDIVHSFLPFDFADVYQPRGGSYTEAFLRNAASYENKFVRSFKKLTGFVNIRRTKFLRSEKRLCQNPDGPVIAALSNYVSKQFKEHYNVSDERIAVIPNGVAINKQVDTAEADKLRSRIIIELGIKEADNPVFFLFAANNFRLKGLGPLIEAFSKCGDRPCYLVIAGKGKVNKYHNLASKLKIGSKIIFVGSVRSIQNVLSISDVAALPTYYDPSSRFILEGLAASKPVITTRYNGAADMFESDRHGKVIAEPGNINALSEAIIYFSNTENIQRAAKAIVDDNIKDKISTIRVAKQLDNLYKSIIEKRR